MKEGLVEQPETGVPRALPLAKVYRVRRSDLVSQTGLGSHFQSATPPRTERWLKRRTYTLLWLLPQG